MEHTSTPTAPEAQELPVKELTVAPPSITPPVEPPPAPQPEIINVVSLADLQSFVDQPITVLIQFGLRHFHVFGRRLRPDEDASLDDIMATVLPPVIRGDKPENDRTNWNHPDYVKAKAVIDLEARALGLYWCIPIFAKEKPNMTERKMITQFIQTKFTEQILDVLWQGIRDGGVKKAALVNFTLPNTSQGS